VRTFAIAGAVLAASASALVFVPLLFVGAPASAASGCGGSGAVDGHVVPSGVEAAARTPAQRAGVDDACVTGVVTGDPFGGLCRPTTLQAYGAVELFTPDGRHHGIDIACQEGASIFSVTGGAVFDVASGCANGGRDTCGAGYGNHVVVRVHGRVQGDLSDHDYFVVYGHLLIAPLVGPGQEIQPGTQLGQQGDSGLSWGSHLHFEVDRDAWNTLRSIDPSPFLPPGISRVAQR
jgi:murein DD-endopeptidase MepM/ murein hydrolase activator NlpD